MLFQMLEESSKNRNFDPVTQKQFNDWRNGYIFDGLRSLRYGQSFCNTFGITDHILYYTMNTINDADEYIRKTYIKE